MNFSFRQVLFLENYRYVHFIKYSSIDMPFIFFQNINIMTKKNKEFNGKIFIYLLYKQNVDKFIKLYIECG